MKIISHSDEKNIGYGSLFFLIRDFFIESGDKTLIISLPVNFFNFKKFSYLTTWETNKLPSKAILNLNKSDFIVLLSKWNKSIFEQNKISVPVYNIPPFYNPLYTFQDFVEKENIIYGTVFNVESFDRKNILFLIESFIKFCHNKNTNLVIKTDHPIEINHPKIKIITNNYNIEQMKEFYKKIDCYISTSRGEGLGFCLLEAMACGRPIITPFHSGVMDYVTNDHCFAIDFEFEIAKKYYENCGNWIKIKKDSFLDKLNYTYNNINILRNMGISASEYAKKFDIYSSVNELTHILKQHDYL